MNIIVFTGFVAGIIHVLTGVDHLIAIAPLAIQSPGRAIKFGFKWGIGHSIGIVILGTFSVIIKDTFHIVRISSFAELSIGIALLIVGVQAVRNSLGLNIHSHRHVHNEDREHEHVHFHLRGQRKHNYHSHSTTSWGLLHGFAGGSHLIAIFPVLALPPITAIAYIAFYLIGSTTAMSMAVCAISIFSSRANLQASSLLIGIIGGLSMATGIFWMGQSFSSLT